MIKAQLLVIALVYVYIIVNKQKAWLDVTKEFSVVSCSVIGRGHKVWSNGGHEEATYRQPKPQQPEHVHKT